MKANLYMVYLKSKSWEMSKITLRFNEDGSMIYSIDLRNPTYGSLIKVDSGIYTEII